MNTLSSARNFQCSTPSHAEYTVDGLKCKGGFTTSDFCESCPFESTNIALAALGVDYEILPVIDASEVPDEITEEGQAILDLEAPLMGLCDLD